MADLNLNGSKGDGTLRLSPTPAVNPSDVAPLNVADPSAIQAKPLIDFQNDPLSSIGNIIGSAAAGALGDTQFNARKRQQRNQQAQMKRDNLVKGNDFASKLLMGGRGLTGKQREQYRESAGTAIDKLGIPQLSEMFQANFDQPELATAFTDIADQTTLGQQFLSQDPTGESWLKFKGSPDGQQFIADTADDAFLAPAQQKANNIISSLDELARAGTLDKKTLDRVQADGKISVPELRELLDAMPEGGTMDAIKLTPEELSTLTADRNLDGLRSMGISLAEDFEPEDLKGSGKTVTDIDGNITGTLVTTNSGGNMVQPAGGAAPRPFAEGEFVTTISDDAEGAGIGKKTQSKLEDTLIGSQATLDNLDASIRDFDRQFLTIGGKAKFIALSAASKTGVPLSNESKEFLSDFATFKAGTLVTLNEEIKRITGAAVTKSEANDRIIPSMPNADDAPDVYMAKMNTVRERLQVVKLRTVMALEQGLKASTDIPWQTVVNQIEDGSLPQKRMDALIAEGMTDQEAFDKVETEFPTSMLDKAMNKGQ